MSEELAQRGLSDKGLQFGEFEYYPTYSTTIKQYKQAKIVNNIDYGEYEKRKSDGLIVDRRNEKDIKVILVLEYKKPVEFQTDKQKKEAIEQCNDLCQILGSRIGVITDGIVTYWINPNQPNEENEYKDRTTDTSRSYSFILNEDRQKIQTKFMIKEISQSNYEQFDDYSKETYQTIKKILHDVSDKSSTLVKMEEVDPLNLARNVWQDIYVNTGKDPTKCLYNVVELFIFKFLSDLNVLNYPYDIKSLVDMYKKGKTNKEVLEFYARNSRKEIKKLFPEGTDKTSIINGTIFVDKNGNPVESQATLFRNSVIKYAEFDSLRNIKKEFKTKLFEVFLKQSHDKSRLGQFFTPRKVVRAIVEMADIDSASFICDPFCGVGGFVLEPLQVSPKLKQQFQPNNESGVKVKFLGLDKGSDEDEQRIIILAKANMLIYLSDILENNPSLSSRFAIFVNETFKLLTDSNLGSLKIKFGKEEDKPDLILTNPPYVKKGSSSLRKEIIEENLESDFKNSGVGVEGLALKWIVNNLRRGGRAFIIIPNGILDNFSNNNLREMIKKECYINCIISLPRKTFFNSTKKTYIFGIEKKVDEKLTQDFPVFTYLVSEIGESLDVNRFEIEKNDLEKAKNLYNQFKGCKKDFEVDDPRCKLIDFNTLDNSKYWVIEKFWENKELIDLNIKEEKKSVEIRELDSSLSGLIRRIEESKEKIKKIGEEIGNIKFVERKITDIFHIELGKAIYTKKYINDNKGEYPVYSAQTTNDGEIGKINHYDWDIECLTWSIDGSYPGRVFHRKGKFSMTCHSGLLVIKDQFKDKLSYRYFYFLLNNHLPNYAVGYGNQRLKKTHLEKDVEKIKIPINEDGDFSLEKQKEIADKYEAIKSIKKSLETGYDKILKLSVIIS